MRIDNSRPSSKLRRWRGLVAAAITYAAAAHGAPAATVRAAAGDAYAISYQSGIGAGAPSTLAIAGNWSTPCTPTFDSASLDGANLRIDAHAVLNLCVREPTAYTIELDPSAAVGRRLPGGIYHVSYYAADGTQSLSKLRAFALVDTAAGANLGPAPESGFWWTTAGGRNGGRSVFSIEVQGSQLTAALMSYDRDGRGNWQVG